MFTKARSATSPPTPRHSAVVELQAQQRRAEVQRLREELADMNARAREEALDRPRATPLRAYRQAYGRDPRGWPPE